MNEIILDLCGGTGAWSKPYKDAGYDVRLITLPKYDVKSFIRDREYIAFWNKKEDAYDAIIIKNIYGILAAPPCTHLAGSGARWWKVKGEKPLLEALEVVNVCMKVITTVKPRFWALENPIGRLVHYLGKPKMYFHPCDYGDPYLKRTCLWGEFNKPKKNPVEPTEGMKLHRMYGGKSERTKRMRSITPQGFAKAFYKANP